MTATTCRSALLLLALATCQPVLSQDTSPVPSAEVSDAIKKVYPALVRIYVVMEEGADGTMKKMQGSGSGAIISPEGHVLTNHHVAGRGTRFVCTLSNHDEVDATLVGTDALADLAVLKLDLSTRRFKDQPLAVATFGDSDSLKTGDGALFLLERMADFRISARAKVARTFQNIRLFSGMTALENLMVAQHNPLMVASNWTLGGLVGLSGFRIRENQAIETAKYWLEKTGLTHRADDPAGDLPDDVRHRPRGESGWPPQPVGQGAAGQVLHRQVRPPLELAGLVGVIGQPLAIRREVSPEIARVCGDQRSRFRVGTWKRHGIDVRGGLCCGPGAKHHHGRGVRGD